MSNRLGRMLRYFSEAWLEAAQPWMAKAPWVESLISSAAAFPNAAHDDDIDAMTQALLRWASGAKPMVAVL